MTLRWMAGHDALTGLANRRLFHALAQTLLRADTLTARALRPAAGPSGPE